MLAMNSTQTRWAPAFLGLKARIAALHQTLDSSWTLRCLLGLVACLYILAYLGHPVLPGNSRYPLGWWGWWDQGKYLESAAAIAQGTLGKDAYLYPLGYPLLAAPFYCFAPKHAFFLPNLFLVLGCLALYYKLARRLVSALEALLLIFVFLFFYRGLLRDTLVVPWNTIPTQFLSYAVFALLCFHKPSPREVYAASMCVAAACLFRISEFASLLPCLAIGILSLRDTRRMLRAACFAAGLIGFSVVSILLINRTIFGSWRTPYDLILAKIGFAGYPLLWKCYLLFVDGAPVLREPDQMMLSHFPWLFLCVPALCYVLQRYGRQALGMILAIVLSFGLYLSYNDFWPTNIYRYLLIHYLVWTFPLLALLLYAGLKGAWSTRLGRWSFLSIPLLLAAISFVSLREKTLGRFSPANAAVIPIAASPVRRVDWVVLHGASAAPRISAGDKDFFTPGEFQASLRPDGAAILISSRSAVAPLQIIPANPLEVREVEFGELVWTLRWSPRWILYQCTRHLVHPKITFSGMVSGVDLAGPSGVPDGVADEVMYVKLPGWVMRQIKEWRIELEDGQGTWISTPNHGYWLINIDYPHDLQVNDSSRVSRLCFADNGNISVAEHIRVKALDSLGRLVVESDVRRPRPQSH
jgi:hypothetical protein